MQTAQLQVLVLGSARYGTYLALGEDEGEQGDEGGSRSQTLAGGHSGVLVGSLSMVCPGTTIASRLN